MTSFTDGIRNGIRGAYCSSTRLTEQFWGNFPSLLRPQPIAALARFWNRQYCNVDEELPPFLNPQPEGGQCPGVDYEVCVTTTSSGGTPGSTCRTGEGPFGGMTLIPTGSGTNVNLGFEFADGRRSWRTLSAAEGQVQLNNLVVDSIVRIDGLPDDCGEIPDPLPDPAPIETTINITYGDNDEFNLTTPIFFLPVINNFNGELRIPFELPDLEIEGDINVTPDGDIDFDFDFPDPLPVPEGDVELPEVDPDPDDDLPEDEEPEPDPDGDPPILGVFGKVTTTSRARQTTILQPEAPNILAPRVGNARFRVSTGSGSTWTSDIPIKNQDFFVECPASWGAIEAKVTAEPGVAIEWGVLRGFTTFLTGELSAGEGGISDRRSEIT